MVETRRGVAARKAWPEIASGTARATGCVVPRDRDNQLRCSGLLFERQLAMEGLGAAAEAGTNKETDGQPCYPWWNRRPLFWGQCWGQPFVASESSIFQMVRPYF